MKMKHVMAALLFGVVAVGSAQAQEKHYKYYPVTTEIYGEVIINTTDLDEACRLGVDSYNERWVQPSSRGRYAQVGHGKYEQRWFDDSKNGRPIRYILCAFQERVKNKDGSWGEWKDENSASFAKFSCRDGGSFLFRTKDICAEKRDGPIPEESKCDPSYYPNGIVPADCPKNKPEIDPVTGFPKNDSLCDGKSRGSRAGVACEIGKKDQPCYWGKKEDLEKNFPNQKVLDILYKCEMEHETFHANDDVGAKCEDGRKGGKTEYDQARREEDAYGESVKCYVREKAQCGDDEMCHDLIGGNENKGIKGLINFYQELKNKKKAEKENLNGLRENK